MKVKLFRYTDFYTDYYDGYETILTQGITDWEEITEEDFTYIKRNINLLRQVHGPLVIIAQPDITAIDAIESIKAEIERIELIELNRKKETADKKAQKQREKELEQLRKLQEKYGTDE